MFSSWLKTKIEWLGLVNNLLILQDVPWKMRDVMVLIFNILIHAFLILKLVIINFIVYTFINWLHLHKFRYILNN